MRSFSDIALGAGCISNFKLIPSLPAVETGAVSGTGPTPASPLDRLRADLSNEIPMGSLPNRRTCTRRVRFMTAGPAALRLQVPEDMLLRNAEVQYVCR